MEIKKGSSIWKLATRWDVNSLPRDFCTLCRSVFINFMMVCVICGCSGWFLGDLTANLVGWFVTGWWHVNLSVAILMILSCTFGILTALGLLVFGVVEGGDVAMRKIETKEVYRAWKDKYCPIVKEVK